MAFALTLGAAASCADFLDVVPDERTKASDAYADANKGRNFLYSCYAYLPNPANTPGGLDMLTGDEVVTAFEHETFSRFPKGTFSPSDPVISYWNSLFRGIRQCYDFLGIIDRLPDTSDEDKGYYKAEAKFLIAYYHYQLLRCYGPILLIKELPSITVREADFPKRMPLDECVTWIAQMYDEAAAGLPTKWSEQDRFGRATSTAAKALKAKLLVYAASPLFNGGYELYRNFQDKDGVLLMPSTPDPKKWEVAKAELKKAITAAETAGYSLYMRTDYKVDRNAYPSKDFRDGAVRRMRSFMHDYDVENPEVIFADTRGPGYYDIQLKSVPRAKEKWNQGATGISLTWAMLNRFYTKNGLPWDEDPEFAAHTSTESKLELVTVDEAHKDEAIKGRKTMRFNLDREPRFYSWVSFQNGYFEVIEEEDDTYPVSEGFMVAGQKGRVLLNFLKDGNQGRKNRTNNYSPGGYLNKKACPPDMGMKRGGVQNRSHPWPVIRLADLFLLYAEACVETGDLAEAKVYLDKVRVRAGIPTVDEAWSKVPGVNLDQNKMRQIVRQERQIEMYLENQNFWDMRRWLLARDAYNKKPQGMDISANTLEDFAKLTTIDFERRFDPHHYLLPIPLSEIQKSTKLVQNPGY